MTIKKPPKNILDKILKVFGKERDIVVPDNTDELFRKYGPHITIGAKRESFLKVLFSKRSGN